MAPFVPLILPTPLPKVGTTIEHLTIDAKAKLGPDSFEWAKDVAAFANQLGGNLIIGLAEQAGVIRAIKPLTKKDAAEVRDKVSKEVAKRCSPKPTVTFQEYPEGAGFVVVVVVYPYVGQVVGVKTDADPRKGGYGGPAWVFPLRVATDTSYLEPGQLSMLMLPEYRKAVINLSQISELEKVELVGSVATGGQARQGSGIMGKVDLAKNTFYVERTPTSLEPVFYAIPIDSVKTVWKTEVVWRIAVKGAFQAGLPGLFIPE
jgi:hypothetical protein